jgi:hypothetical protein
LQPQTVRLLSKIEAYDTAVRLRAGSTGRIQDPGLA